MEKLKSPKILGIIGVIVTLIGIFLPFAEVSASILGYKSSESVTFIEGDGVIVLILTIVAALMIFSDLLSNKIKFFDKLSNPKLVLIPTIISIAILIYDMINTNSAIDGLSSIVEVTYGIGTWIMWVGLIATVVYAFIYKKAE